MTTIPRIVSADDHVVEPADVFSSRLPGEDSGIVSLLTPGRDPKELMKRCKLAGVIVNLRAGRLRMSPHAYNTVEEIDRFVEAIR